MKLGEIQELVVVREVPFGVYLSTDLTSEEEVLLPKSNLSKSMSVGEKINVFVYKDSEDRWIATTHMPLLTVGQVGALRVVEKTRIGAFLDWGLEKDLLLPFKQQLTEVEVGERYLVALYVDKTERLCATMKIYNTLQCSAPYAKNQSISGIIYQIRPDFGAFVAVEGKYHGLIPASELTYSSYCVGDKVEARIKQIREDGKLVLSLRRQTYQQIDKDVEVILEKLRQTEGQLPLHDKSTPQEIKQKLNMSKAAFKRAVGRLLKEGAIELSDRGIKKRY